MFDIKITEIKETEKTNTGTFLQTPFWCEFKSRHGWEYKRFLISASYEGIDISDSEPAADSIKKIIEYFSLDAEASLLIRSFCKNMLAIAYLPLFPKIPAEFVNPLEPEKDITIEISHYLNDLAKALKPFLPSNVIALRFDPDLYFYNPEDRDEYNYGIKNISYADRLKLKKNKVDIQPPDSTLVDLTGTEEEILNKMHQKWRYNIRLSERKGVVIHRYLGNDVNMSEKIDKFYELTKETNARDGNSSHAKSYYFDLLKSSADEIANGKDVPVISLYIAEHEGDEIASIMTLFSKDEAIYLYGASSNNKRNLMPNHLLQWTAMKDAKAYGSKFYDMYGMPPEGKDEHHPMHGLYMFKANFGGTNIHRVGSWDVGIKFIYKLYSAAESFRAFWHKKVIKKLKGR